MDKRGIGKRIYIARKEKDRTLQDIATDIGLARSTIQRYESGKIENAKLPVIEAIARSIDVNPAWILGKSEQKEPLQDYSTNDSSMKSDGITYKGKHYPLDDMPQEVKTLFDYIEKTFLQE